MEFPVKQTDEVALCWPYGKPACLNVSLLQRIHKAAPDSFGLVEIALTEEIYDTCIKGVAEMEDQAPARCEIARTGIPMLVQGRKQRTVLHDC